MQKRFDIPMNKLSTSNQLLSFVCTKDSLGSSNQKSSASNDDNMYVNDVSLPNLTQRTALEDNNYVAKPTQISFDCPSQDNLYVDIDDVEPTGKT